MGLFDTVTVDVLSAAFQTKQLGEGMVTYRLGENGRLVAPCGREIGFHGLSHLLGDDGAEFMAVFTHGELESLDPIVERVSAAYRLLGRGVLWARRTGDLIAVSGGRRGSYLLDASPARRRGRGRACGVLIARDPAVAAKEEGWAWELDNHQAQPEPRRHRQQEGGRA